MEITTIGLDLAKNVNRLWFDAGLDVTKFGSINVKRIDENTVQILPDDYDFDLKFQNAQRDLLTALQGIRAGGLSTPRRSFGVGRSFTIIFDGVTRIKP